jgi:hypothetical protein
MTVSASKTSPVGEDDRNALLWYQAKVLTVGPETKRLYYSVYTNHVASVPL